MKQKFDANTAIEMTRWMPFACGAVTFLLLIAGLRFVSSENIPASIALISISAPLSFLAVAFNTMFQVFRSQQSEIENLKAAVERLQNGDFPAESMTAPQIEGVTTS